MVPMYSRYPVQRTRNEANCLARKPSAKYLNPELS